MFSQQKSYRPAGQTASTLVLTVLTMLLMVASPALVGVAGAQSDSLDAIGCGTATLEHSQSVSGVDLVGNAGPADAAITVDLGIALTAGDYLVRAISMDSHWDEPADEPREQFFVTIGATSTDPIADLPNNADFLGSEAATATNLDLENVAPEALPGADLGVISLAGGESTATFTHIDLGSGDEANSISAAMVSIACATTGLDISFDETTIDLDGNASLTLNVANNSANDQTGIRIRSRFPVGVQQVGDIVMTAGSSTAVGKVIRWEGDLAAGESAQIVLPITTSEEGLARCGVVLETTCHITATMVGVDGGVPTSAPAVVELAVPAGSDLEVSISYNPLGQDKTSLIGRVTAVVTNNADTGRLALPADDVVVVTDVPSDLTVDVFSFGATAGSVLSNDAGQEWTVGSLAPGESAALSFNVELPLAGEYSVRAQVLSATGNDLDSTPGNLAARTSRTDTVIVEDDEAAVLAVATVPATTTTTTTTRAPATTTTVAEEEGFLLPEGVELPDPVATESPEVAESDDDRTEVAGAVEERQEPIATIELKQGDSTGPIALSIAATLVALSAAVLYMDRRKKDEAISAALPASASTPDALDATGSTAVNATDQTVTDPWIDNTPQGPDLNL